MLPVVLYNSTHLHASVVIALQEFKMLQFTIFHLLATGRCPQKVLERTRRSQ